jgi:hypothetical protein
MDRKAREVEGVPTEEALERVPWAAKESGCRGIEGRQELWDEVEGEADEETGADGGDQDDAIIAPGESGHGHGCCIEATNRELKQGQSCACK